MLLMMNGDMGGICVLVIDPVPNPAPPPVFLPSPSTRLSPLAFHPSSIGIRCPSSVQGSILSRVIKAACARESPGDASDRVPAQSRQRSRVRIPAMKHHDDAISLSTPHPHSISPCWYSVLYIKSPESEPAHDMMLFLGEGGGPRVRPSRPLRASILALL